VKQGSSRNVGYLEVRRWESAECREVEDVVAVEEPLEIRVDVPGAKGRVEIAISVTMRTPGDDFPLAAGFLLGEGIVSTRDEVVDLRYCRKVTPQEFNVVTATLRNSIDPALLTRNFYTTSSCGVCGKASIAAVEAQVAECAPVPEGLLTISPERILDLPDRLREAQAIFERTGGLHAAGLFDGSGAVVDVREDVGRHNAVDKVTGAAFLDGRIPLADHVMVVSGRLSFDIVQKAVTAGIPALVAVGAPSSLAVDLAKQFGVTLIGFVRGGSFNVYSGAERVDVAPRGGR
jgi:FdhD protein